MYACAVKQLTAAGIKRSCLKNVNKTEVTELSEFKPRKTKVFLLWKQSFRDMSAVLDFSHIFWQNCC